MKSMLLLTTTVVVALLGACVAASAAAAAAPAGTGPAAAGAASAAAVMSAGTSGDVLATPGAAVAAMGIVTRDGVALRAGPSATSAVQTTLWRGEVLELRAERGEYIQVWDHQRERGGFVAASLVYRIPAGAGAATTLQAVLGFVAEQPQSESLGLAFAAAAIQALPAADLAGPAGATLLDTVGRLGDRLADRAQVGTANRPSDAATLTAHLDVAARQGVRFTSREGESGRVTLCADGAAWRRLLTHPAASTDQRARAALALTRDECRSVDAHPRQREEGDRQRAALLDRALQVQSASGPSAGPAALSTALRNRLEMRRAAVGASLSFAAARRGDASAARAAAERALSAFAQVATSELADDDALRYAEAALRVSAVRWAANPAVATAEPRTLAIRTAPATDGRTCVQLVDTRWKDAQPALAERCTWGQVWAASASVSREVNAMALAVQPLDGWRELWVFHRLGKEWTVSVLPPAPVTPSGAGGSSVGYVEFAGWVPGGQQLLVAREVLASGPEGRALRRFEVLRMDTLTAERQHHDASQLGAFNRWSDPAWKRDTLALR